MLMDGSRPNSVYPEPDVLRETVQIIWSSVWV